jgi:hypothetical protein
MTEKYVTTIPLQTHFTRTIVEQITLRDQFAMAALRKIDAVSYYGMEGAEMECKEMHEIARKALEGKDD